jgi:hypothetical protein
MEASLFFHRQIWKSLHKRFCKQPPADARHAIASVYAHTLQSATR